MRIIKEDFDSGMYRKAQPAAFTVFPEEWVLATPSIEGEALEQQHPEGGNGKDTVVVESQPAIDLAAIQAQAQQIMADARAEAEGILGQARADADQIYAQAQADADQITAQAAVAGEEAKKDAYASGFSSGEDQGFRKGYEDGYTKGKAAGFDETTKSISMINRVTDELENYRAQILSEAQQDIVKMAVAVAEKVLHKEIMTDPRTIVNVVKNAVGRVGFKKHFMIFVNPLDVEVLQSAGDEITGMIDRLESISFRPDPRVEAGGCIVQTESGTVDAQVDRQFNEVKTSVMNAMQGQG